MPRHLPAPALLLLACLALPSHALAGLNEGEVRSGSEVETETTFTADEFLTLRVPDKPGSGSAIITGNMESFSLSSTAWMSNTPLTLAAASSSAVDFYDAVDLDVPGLPPGTQVRVRLAWSVDADATSSGSSSVLTSARAVLEASGNQIWTVESNNFGDPETWDPSGRVEFDFVLKANTPEEGNIKLTAATEALAILDSENIPPSGYSANPASNLSLVFQEVVSVQTISGFPLPIWTMESSSLFDYGSGNGPVTLSNPVLQIGPSASGPEFMTLSWESSPYELYTIESSTDLSTWTPETQVTGTGSTFSLDVPISGPQQFYQLTNQIGTAG